MDRYDFKLCKIDPYNCSIEELKKEIRRLKDLNEEYNGLQHSIKIFINSVYGACASPYFVGYNIYVAEAVTLQGQNLIHYANDILDDYFLNHWHNDKELHKVMGLTKVSQILMKSLIVYNDTDSTYVTFEPVLKSCDWKGNPVEFILQLKKLRISDYLKQKFEEYAKKFNTKDLQNLELEKISYSALMMAKKKYVLDLAWKEPGIDYLPQQKISPTGVEIVQSSTPKFARKALKELLKYIFENGKTLNYSNAVKKLKDYKQQFILQSPEDICKGMGIGEYEKYCIEDKKQVVLAEKCPINVRSAVIYNHVLQNSKWKGKYNLIKSGDKIKFYYSKAEEQVFGFLPGDFPNEFAPEIDYDLQFEKTIIEPFNRFIEALGYSPVPGNLIYCKALF
jgi:DNA polymerase elongation subunit (family B)